MTLSFEEGMKYPWGKAKRLWNILWVLIPILGGFAIFGYLQKIVKAMAKGDFKGLPAFGNFWDNTGKGLMLFIKLVPTMVVLWVINWVPVVGWIAYFVIEIFILPWLVINLLVKDDFSAVWEIGKATNIVFKNLQNYVIAFLKQLAFWVIYGIASIVLVGIPCLTFGSYIYLVDFYNKH